MVWEIQEFLKGCLIYMGNLCKPPYVLKGPSLSRAGSKSLADPIGSTHGKSAHQNARKLQEDKLNHRLKVRTPSNKEKPVIIAILHKIILA